MILINQPIKNSTMEKIALIIYLFLSISIYSEIIFEPISINEEKLILFNSLERIGEREQNKTLFLSYFNKNELKFEALTFYPEKLFYSENKETLFIQNRIGLYSFNLKTKEMSTIDTYLNFTKKDEYSLGKLPFVSFSYDYRYFIAKIKNNNIRADIYLFDMEKKTKTKIVDDVEIQPGFDAGIWSFDSNYFIYQKNSSLYYFSITDFFRGKLLSEPLRLIGKGKISSVKWTKNNEIVWIEDNLIYKADSRQFYSRAIYSKYLRQGEVIGKINFNFDPEFDYFSYNDNSKSFILVQGYNSVYYSSLDSELKWFPHLRLTERFSFNSSTIFDSGEGVVIIDELSGGKIKKNIFLIVKQLDSTFIFKEFKPEDIKNQNINSLSFSDDYSKIIVNTSGGAFCYDFKTLKLIWKYEEQEVYDTVHIKGDNFIIAGKYKTVIKDKEANYQPIFASSFSDAGFAQNSIAVKIIDKFYVINRETKNLIQFNGELTLNKTTKNRGYRIVEKELKKGFYYNELYLKDLYSGRLYPIVEKPQLLYTVYQPETISGIDYFKDSKEEKYEVALLFDCTTTAEGIYQIVTTLSYYNIKSSFFINGTFMQINPIITKEITAFNVEIGNMFQHYVNLVDTNFTLDPNFVRQGLSSNEETFYRITGKNFAPYWHSPMYAYNESVIKYGNEAGYTFVNYTLDSLDWVGKNNRELSICNYMTSSEIIKKIVQNIKPGYIIALSTGKNGSDRDDWLFNNLDLLISELIRNGYSFTTVGDIMKKYRKQSN